ncbi:MAG: PDZ domain-containing protein [Saprospiraceae bacterium]|nr:PDZ domain-containing protein [Saprospiraceae bacterium]
MKQLHILCFFILALCVATTASAQKTTPETDKKVVVIKKSVDENGEYVVEKVIKSGDEAEFVLDLNMEDKDCATTWKRLHEESEHDNAFFIGDADARHVLVDVQQTDGHKVIRLNVDGTEEVIELQEGEALSAEQKQRLHERGVHLIEGDGDLSFGGNMIWHIDDDHDGDNEVHVFKKRIADKFDRDFNFDFNFDDSKWASFGHLNCAALGVYVGHGARVSSLIDQGGAQAAGIQPGDVITSINGESTDNGELHHELGKYEPGDVVTVGYRRDGVEATTEVTLTSWTDLPKFANSERHASVKCGEPAPKPSPRPRIASYSKKLNCAALGVYVNSETDGKLVISSLIGSGGAETAGLQAGDVIAGIDKTPVSTHGELLKVLSEYEPGDRVTVDYERDGVTSTVQTTLTSWTDLPAFADSPRHAAIKCGDEAYEGAIDLFEPVEISRKVIIIKKGQDEVVEETVEPEEDEVVETRSYDNTLELLDFVTYPNPTDGKFRVEFRADPLPIVVSIIDVSGKEVFRDNMDQFSGWYNKEINLTDEARGAFILSIEQDGKIFTEQVILH